METRHFLKVVTCKNCTLHHRCATFGGILTADELFDVSAELGAASFFRHAHKKRFLILRLNPRGLSKNRTRPQEYRTSKSGPAHGLPRRCALKPQVTDQRHPVTASSSRDETRHVAITTNADGSSESADARAKTNPGLMTRIGLERRKYAFVPHRQSLFSGREPPGLS